MTTRPRTPKSRPKNPETVADTVVPAPRPADSAGSGTAADAAVAKLTPEEQLERFAQELKNEDWGHQPC